MDNIELKTLHLKNQFGRSQIFIDRTLGTLMPLLQKIFGCEVVSPERFSRQKCLYIANHNIGVILEGMTMLYAWEKQFKQTKYCYAMAHRFFFNFPIASYIMKSFGCILASYECAEAAFKENNSVVLFPGGNYECIRTYDERHICDFNQAKGWIKVALKNQVNIVPLAITGSHHVNPIFVRSKFLSYFLILPILFKVRWMPISLSQIVYTTLCFFTFPLFMPFWLSCVLCYFIFGFSFLFPLLPTNLQVHIEDEFNPLIYNTENKTVEALLTDSVFLQKCYDHVTQVIQNRLTLVKG